MFSDSCTNWYGSSNECGNDFQLKENGSWGKSIGGANSLHPNLSRKKVGARVSLKRLGENAIELVFVMLVKMYFDGLCWDILIQKIF